MLLCCYTDALLCYCAAVLLCCFSATLLLFCSLYNCTALLLNFCTAALLKFCTTVLLYCLISALLKFCTTALLYCSISALLHCCIAALLHCCTAALFRSRCNSEYMHCWIITTVLKCLAANLLIYKISSYVVRCCNYSKLLVYRHIVLLASAILVPILKNFFEGRFTDSICRLDRIIILKIILHFPKLA